MSIAENIHIGKLSKRSNPLSVVSMLEAKFVAIAWIRSLNFKAISLSALTA